MILIIRIDWNAHLILKKTVRNSFWSYRHSLSTFQEVVERKELFEVGILTPRNRTGLNQGEENRIGINKVGEDNA